MLLLKKSSEQYDVAAKFVLAIDQSLNGHHLLICGVN